MNIPRIDLREVFAQLRDPRNLTWKTGAVLAAVIVARVLLYRGSGGKELFFSEENAVAGNTIVGGLERVKLPTGKYPDKLALPGPTYAAATPEPVPYPHF